MPGGGTLLGLGYFAGIKLAGYSLAGVYLNRQYQTSKPRPLLFGAARTAIGIGVGVAYVGAANLFELHRGEVIWLLLLVPVRLGEWLLAIWLFFDRARASPLRMRLAAKGVIWSFVLDLPALFAAFSLPGGMWIC